MIKLWNKWPCLENTTDYAAYLNNAVTVSAAKYVKRICSGVYQTRMVTSLGVNEGHQFNCRWIVRFVMVCKRRQFPLIDCSSDVRKWTRNFDIMQNRVIWWHPQPWGCVDESKLGGLAWEARAADSFVWRRWDVQGNVFARRRTLRIYRPPHPSETLTTSQETFVVLQLQPVTAVRGRVAVRRI